MICVKHQMDIGPVAVSAGPAIRCCGLPMEPPLEEYALADTRRLWYCATCGAYHEERRGAER